MLRRNRALMRSRSIDDKIEEERERRQKEVQLLILGGASSGKSTFIKQLRLHHGDGYPEEERKNLLVNIYENLVDGINILVENMKLLGIEFADSSNKVFAQELQRDFPQWRIYQPPISSINKDLKNKTGVSDFFKLEQYPEQIKKLIKDASMQKCIRCPDLMKIPLVHAEEYFVENVVRVFEPGYLPTVLDILMIRKPTLGVQEHIFTIDNIRYRVIDVAGQKNHRKKWIHLFEGVTAVLFFVAISGFCEKLEEETSLNSLEDSLTIFDEVISNRFLEKTDFILFLNKKDIFEDYLKTRHLSSYFPEYTGPNTLEACTKFIQDCFNKRKPSQKNVYYHLTCAIDRELMKNVIDEVMQIIVSINLRQASAPL